MRTRCGTPLGLRIALGLGCFAMTVCLPGGGSLGLRRSLDRMVWTENNATIAGADASGHQHQNGQDGVDEAVSHVRKQPGNRQPEVGNLGRLPNGPQLRISRDLKHTSANLRPQ